MADHDDPKQGPNPAFLRTKLLGTQRVHGLDYEDEAPTGVDHKPSNRPGPRAIAPARVDPGDVYMLTDRPVHQGLPSFADTVVGPGSLETPRTDLPPVRPIRGAAPAGVSPLAHSPTPPPPRAAWPTATAHAPDAPQPTAPVLRSSPPQVGDAHRPSPWKPIHPAPRYLPRPGVTPPIKPDPSIYRAEPAPVEDRLLNALVVLVLALGIVAGATWAFLTVTHTRGRALSDFVSSPADASEAK